MRRPIDRVLERLEGAKAHNGYFMAPCPAHDDREPSLSVKEGDDGRVLLKCFAGCPFEGIVAAVGLEPKDLFPDGGGGGGYTPPRNGATVQRPPGKPRGDAEKTVADPNATPDATPPDGVPHLRLVASDGERVEGCTFDAYVEYVGLPADFLRGLGLKEIHYIDQKAVKIPYFDATGSEEACVRFRVSLTGKPKVKTRKGDKHRLYGLWKLEEAREKGYAILVEGESDSQVGWYHGEPVIGVPGATGFQGEWAAELDGIGKVYAIVEPDEAGDAFWQRLAATHLRERLCRVELDGAKDLRDLHALEHPDAFKDRLHDALRRGMPWLDLAESEARERYREAWSRCEELARSVDILEEFYKTLRDSGVAGERRTAMILYLALTSRRLDRPVSVAVKGPSSGGKSYLVERVLEYFPERAFYALTAMSEKTLAYSEEPIKHRFLVLYEAAGMNGDFQTYLIRSLLSEGKLRYETVEKTPEGLKPRMIEREGPTGLIVTTTMDKLHPENETRLLSLSVTDTQEQTRQVLRALAEEEVSPPDLGPWVALQEWVQLADRRVSIPFVKVLAEKVPPVAVRLRRDFSAVLNLIRAHAVLHQATRERDDQGRIVATVHDYAVVRELVADLVAEGVDATVSATVRATVEKVAKLVDDEGGDPVSLGPIAEGLKLDKSAASRRVKTAIGKGFLKNLEDRRGKPGRYVLGDPMPDDVVVLPEPDEVLQALQRCSVDEGDKTPPPPPSTDDDPGVEI